MYESGLTELGENPDDSMYKSQVGIFSDNPAKHSRKCLHLCFYHKYAFSHSTMHDIYMSLCTCIYTQGSGTDLTELLVGREVFEFDFLMAVSTGKQHSLTNSYVSHVYQARNGEGSDRGEGKEQERGRIDGTQVARR